MESVAGVRQPEQFEEGDRVRFFGVAAERRFREVENDLRSERSKRRPKSTHLHRRQISSTVPPSDRRLWQWHARCP